MGPYTLPALSNQKEGSQPPEFEPEQHQPSSCPQKTSVHTTALSADTIPNLHTPSTVAVQVVLPIYFLLPSCCSFLPSCCSLLPSCCFLLPSCRSLLSSCCSPNSRLHCPGHKTS